MNLQHLEYEKALPTLASLFSSAEKLYQLDLIEVHLL